MKKGLVLVVLLIFGIQSWGQIKYIAKNLERFDERKYHFGFIVGANKGSLLLDLASSQVLVENKVTNIRVEPLPGLDLAIVASYNLHKNIRIRTIPGISFQDRKIHYTLINNEGEAEEEFKVTETTNIELPILFKFRTNRYGNFAAYALAGGKYSVDMASKKKKNSSSPDDQNKLLLDKKDYSATLGAGFDFFLPYFKFGIEVRYSRGIKNLLIPEGTQFTNPINGLRGQTFQFCMTFEG